MYGVCENKDCKNNEKQVLFQCYYCRKHVCFQCYKIIVGERVCEECKKALNL